jgi:hypothetical protein
LFRFGDYRLSANYNFLDATFESPYISFSPVNPQEPSRQVNPVDTIPGQPKFQSNYHLIGTLLKTLMLVVNTFTVHLSFIEVMKPMKMLK